MSSDFEMALKASRRADSELSRSRVTEPDGRTFDYEPPTTADLERRAIRLALVSIAGSLERIAALQGAIAEEDLPSTSRLTS